MTSTSPFVSIIITCYNYVRYVGLAIDSALGQTYPHIEVLVVDDGSTDGSDSVIAGYSDRIVSIRQKNQGHVPATNTGFSRSRGDIVVFLDADDYLSLTMVEEVVKAWHPDCVKVQGDLTIIDADGNELGRRFCNFSADYDADRIQAEFRRFGTYIWPVTSGNAYSRWFLNQVMPLTVSIGPDGELCTIAPVYGQIYVVPKPFAYYRLHGGNMSMDGGGRKVNHPPFAKAIALRCREFDILRRHAAKHSVALPDGNLLDHEIVFINYRLMAWKLGLAYEGQSQDSILRLWRKGCQIILRRSATLRTGLVHFVWITTLSVAPGCIAGKLVLLRYGRGAIRQSIRQLVTRNAREAVPQRPSP